MPTLHQRWGQLGRVQIPNIGSSRWHSMFTIQIVWGKNPAWESVSWLFQLGCPSYLAENMACPKPPNDNDTNLGEGTVHHFVRWRRWYENFTFEQTWSNLIWLHLRRPKKILPGIELSWLARHIVAARHGCFGDASMEVSSLYDPLMSPHLLEHHTEAWSWRFLWHS